MTRGCDYEGTLLLFPLWGGWIIKCWNFCWLPIVYSFDEPMSLKLLFVWPLDKSTCLLNDSIYLFSLSSSSIFSLNLSLQNSKGFYFRLIKVLFASSSLCFMLLIFYYCSSCCFYTSLVILPSINASRYRIQSGYSITSDRKLSNFIEGYR